MRISRSFAETMTAARQQRKQYRPGDAAFASLLAILAAVATTSRAATTEMLVVDRHTGLAIGGYDPIAFYTDGKPMTGKPDFEFRYGGAVWRFCNVGNREAFAARPDVYMPKFGGYDPVGVAHGVAVAGNPSVWSITGGRLFLFYDRERLAIFAADAERITGTAERKWPEVLRTLSP
jgi:YHS domain-containing protein